MAWEHLSINKPHLVYIILGGFTSIFMLCSLFIKEKLYIGEATVATICGVIFGPHAANLIDPSTWGNTDKITLEFSRIVLVVQCFAVGVELPKAYMERHWRSVVFLLVPVMTFGWLITSVIIWWMIVPISWLESLAVAACVTATDPVLASSVVGKGKFAKRVPKHLRDVLSAESGCNDGMAFPFIYLSIYLLRYNLGAREVIFHWTCYTILYECIFGAFYGFMIGYIGRRAIKAAEDAGLIDRESFLVFYFTLALFCAGSGSMLGMDDLLIGFSAGVGFSNDGSYTEKTEESHVSNVIDLLLNLAYFVYFGTIVPWDQFNAPEHGLVPWRLVIIAIFVVLFRRIPAMLILKPLIPDIKTWREALFAGHFGPIGVGAVFAAILTRAELEHDSTDPLATLPPPGSKDYELMLLVWPVVSFLVVTSILVHGSSIAVFTLGRRINTLALTLSYTKGDEDGPSWMGRLPRISSQSKSMSRASSFDSTELGEKTGLPLAIPKDFLSRHKEGDTSGSRSSSKRPSRRRKKRDSKRQEAGGPIDPSAIKPARRSEPTLVSQLSGSETLHEKSQDPSPHSRQPSYAPDGVLSASPSSSPEREDRESGRPRGRRQSSWSPSRPADVEAYEEGHEMVIEDEEGNVLETVDTRGRSEEQKAAIIDQARRKLGKDKTGQFAKHKGESHAKNEGGDFEKDVEQAVEHPQKSFIKQLEGWRGWVKSKPAGDIEADAAAAHQKSKQPERKKGPAHAYQFGNTLIVEDEDGEVIKKFTLPPTESDGGRRATLGGAELRRGISRLGTFVGMKQKDERPPEAALRPPPEVSTDQDTTGDDHAEGRSTEQGQQRPDPRRGSTTHQQQLKRIEKEMKKQDTQPDDDDENQLRITISKIDRHGWTGLHKEKQGEPSRPGGLQMGGGRRMSAMELLKHLQTLDPKTRIETVEETDAPEGIKRQILRETEADVGAGGRKRASTGPSRQAQKLETSNSPAKRLAGGRDETDYFNLKSQASVGTPGMPMSPGAVLRRPEVERSTTAETMESIASDETPEDIPGVDMRSMLARRSGGSTAAEARRKRLGAGGAGLDTIRSNSDDEDEGTRGIGNETDEPETAAERRRRLAALGAGGAAEDSSSDDEPIEGTERVRSREAPMREGDVVKSGSQRPRVQWDGDIGKERELTKEREELGKSGKKTSGGGLKRLFKG